MQIFVQSFYILEALQSTSQFYIQICSHHFEILQMAQNTVGMCAKRKKHCTQDGGSCQYT